MGVLYAKVSGAWQPILNSNGTGEGGKWEPGDVKPTMRSTASTGWLMLNGQAIANADTAYPDLWNVVPTAWKSGTTLNLPDATDRVLMGGGTLGAVGGANTRTLTIAQLPGHTHTQPTHTHTLNNHTHGAGTLATSSAGTHTHDVSFNQQTNTSTGGTAPRMAGLGSGLVQTTTSVPGHTHDVTGSTAANNGNTGADGNDATGSTGSGNAVDTTPSHMRVNYMIRAAA